MEGRGVAAGEYARAGRNVRPGGASSRNLVALALGFEPELAATAISAVLLALLAIPFALSLVHEGLDAKSYGQ